MEKKTKIFFIILSLLFLISVVFGIFIIIYQKNFEIFIEEDDIPEIYDVLIKI